MKKAVCLLFFAVFIFCSCTADIPDITTVSYDYIYRTTEKNEDVSNDTYTESLYEEASGEQESTGELFTEGLAVQESTTLKNPEQVTEEEIASVKEESTAESSVSAQTSQAVGEIDLSISMPEKNGTMVVDTSAENKFVAIVCNERGIDSGLLAAVYSVPESGQNYVFEFVSGKERSVESLRRVYLIDENGSIVGVAATKSAEMENVTAVENWFCMNVLIKELIYPSVEKDIKG